MGSEAGAAAPSGAGLAGPQAAATDFGRRPRRAAARPGIFAAQSSQRSAALDPRRASVNVTRKVAPLFSPTSFPQLSQMRMVLRATYFPPSRFTNDHKRTQKGPCDRPGYIT